MTSERIMMPGLIVSPVPEFYAYTWGMPLTYRKKP